MIEDLPVDRDKEARLRVQPKACQNRIPSGSVPKSDKDFGKGTIRRKKDGELFFELEFDQVLISFQRTPLCSRRPLRIL